MNRFTIFLVIGVIFLTIFIQACAPYPPGTQGYCYQEESFCELMCWANSSYEWGDWQDMDCWRRCRSARNGCMSRVGSNASY